jgi:hypothetical protein
MNFNVFGEADYESLGETYRQALPFPHLVIEELFSAESLQAIAQEFNDSSSPEWREFRGALQNKRGTAPGANMPHTAQDYFNFLYSGPFLRFLSRITGINNLIPDPDLYGGGMHEVAVGGRFEVHVDFAKHPRTGLMNRLAVITYLNEEWSPEDGGALELWELTPPRCCATVLPTFGRTVIIEQSERSAHGHPAPVRDGCRRRSVIAYFYTAGMDGEAGSDVLATTYVRHEGYSRLQRAELYFRRITPRFVVKRLKTISKAVRVRRS